MGKTTAKGMLLAIALGTGIALVFVAIVAYWGQEYSRLTFGQMNQAIGSTIARSLCQRPNAGEALRHLERGSIPRKHEVFRASPEQMDRHGIKFQILAASDTSTTFVVSMTYRTKDGIDVESVKRSPKSPDHDDGTVFSLSTSEDPELEYFEHGLPENPPPMFAERYVVYEPIGKPREE